MTAPKLRFKEFDGDWNTSKIDEIASVTSGGTPSRGNPEYWNGDIPWVTTSLVDFNVIHSAEEFITKEGVNNSSAKLFPKDTILMAMYGQGITRGKVAILGIEATTNQACCAIKLKDYFDTQFIFQNLMNRYDEIRDLSNDGGQKNLSAGIIKDISINIPSKAEQTKIASFLSAVDEKISQLTQKHELLSQYKQGMMQKLFSQQIRFKADDGSEFGEWETKTLGEICSRHYQGINTVADKIEYQKEGYPILQAKHITSEKLDFEDVRFISKSDFQKYRDKYIPQLNDILFSNIGTIGKVVLVNEAIPFFIAWNIFLLSLKNNTAVPMYLTAFLRWLTSLNYFDNLQTGNATKFINKTDLLDTKINLPCLEEQTKIANFLSAIDQKIEVVAQQIEQAKTWKKGLLQQMFV
ncbi:restriction endonuclease subunit S [uncultured Acinetobacter sp.]|uniref:restriction endonuclease subunit S n=1 Tax=uncultured Acinetobacter sp. TaxID=165433 RepID=UPI00258C1F0F|nr:restriction endonuclease subunit S [uncultured Acinetobacter sp.]